MKNILSLTTFLLTEYFPVCISPNQYHQYVLNEVNTVFTLWSSLLCVRVCGTEGITAGGFLRIRGKLSVWFLGAVCPNRRSLHLTTHQLTWALLNIQWHDKTRTATINLLQYADEWTCNDIRWKKWIHYGAVTHAQCHHHMYNCTLHLFASGSHPHDCILTGNGSAPSWITKPSMTCVSTCGFTMAWGGLFSPFCGALPVTTAGGSLEAPGVMAGVTCAPGGSRAVSTEAGSKQSIHWSP